jgi:hypothetical protein
MPRWVKSLLVIALLALVALAVLVVAGSGEHGPRRHVTVGQSQ